VKAYVYMVRCKNNSLYTGWTNDLAARVAKHIGHKGAKYTKAFTAVKLVYFEELETKSQAMKREYAIKQMTKTHKEALVKGFSGNLRQITENLVK
jgi:putative endonuclease